MTAAALLPRLRAAGAEVVLREGRLILGHASRVPAELLAEARARRADLLAELANDNDTPDNRPFVNDPIERAAIQAEHLPARRLNKRSPSWSNPTDEPQPGDFCACCYGSLWWIETETPKGWRCCQCYGPAHLQPGAFRAVAT
jgi:hypothetical protein